MRISDLRLKDWNYSKVYPSQKEVRNENKKAI